jgi:NAD(P)-dependent dehydrogenase (short-subunit alcohol dehydrogenase family)
MSAQPVVVITGASQGIGAGLVTGYRRLGYAVVANSRTITPNDDAMVLTVPGDIAQRGVGQRIVDAALKRLGRIHMVVNNAGIFIAEPFTEYTDDDYNAITGVNLGGFFSTRSSPNGSRRCSPRTRSSRVCAPIALAAKESSTITRANRRA